MQIYSFKKCNPKIASSSYIAPTAVIIGNVEIKKKANIWFNTVVRGDVASIEIGENTNVQDLCMLHVSKNFSLSIGSNVTVGHSAILHGCTIGNGCLIGMGAKILDGVKVGKHCLVAAGSLVAPGKEFPAGSLIMGSPAKVVRALGSDEIEQISHHYLSYLENAENFREDVELLSKDF